MKEKCNKYEAYFTFASKEDFEKHLQECPDCQAIREQECKLSSLIKDSAKIYKSMKAEKSKKSFIKKAVCILSFFIFFGTYSCFQIHNQVNTTITMTSTETETSIIEEQGLPVDEYGFFAYE